MNILVFGVQGSGKSTHAEYIATKLGVPYIYTGDLFRNLEKDSSKQGKQIKRFMGRGVLIPDQITIPIFEEYLKEFDTSRGLVLDGFPRTKEQAEKLKIKLDLIIYVTLPPEIIIERLKERGRDDDSPEIIKRRIQLYEEKTKPLLDYFAQRKIKIKEIDNSASVEEVWKRIDDLLENS